MAAVRLLTLYTLKPVVSSQCFPTSLSNRLLWFFFSFVFALMVSCIFISINGWYLQLHVRDAKFQTLLAQFDGSHVLGLFVRS